jgi:hypothetical protein
LALSVGRKLLGSSTVGPHPARPVPDVAPHDLPRQADARRGAIGRPILPLRGELTEQVDVARHEYDFCDDAERLTRFDRYSQASTREFEFAFRRLIGIGHSEQDNQLRLPGRLAEKRSK